MREVLDAHKKAIDGSRALADLKLEKGKYFLVSAHREENIDNERNFMSLMSALNTVAETYQMPVIYSTHPRSKNIIEKRGFKFHPLIKSVLPFGFFDYVRLQKDSFCVLSDSGTLSEESGILGFPAVQIRTSTERPEAIDKGSVIIGGITERDILQAINLAAALNRQPILPAPDYADDNVSIKIVKLIQSYAKIVNKTVWDKERKGACCCLRRRAVYFYRQHTAT
jgi:UDP-N-acetylglucosamine 2-epimerase (non-hydrolysing)